MKLVLPSLRYKTQYLDALEETIGEVGETQLNKLDPLQTFEQFVTMWRDIRKGKNLPEGKVPSSMYWLIDNGELIGRVDIRHELNDYLYSFGGHIGYYIKPSKRRRDMAERFFSLD